MYWEMQLDGLSIKFGFSHPYHHLFARSLHMGIHEVQLFKLWKKQAEATTGAILDIGGYNGVFGFIAAAANPRAEVFIFEPDPVNFAHIEQNIALNKFTNVTALQMAVSDTNGSVTFRIHDGGTGGNIEKDGTGFTIPCTTIDSWAQKEHKKPTLIKCDIEGAEYRALLGCRETVAAADKIAFLFELHSNYLSRFGDTEPAVWKLLAEMGFSALLLNSTEKYNTHHYWLYRERS